MLNEVIDNILNEIRNKPKINEDIKHIDEFINKLILDLYFYNKINYLINNKGKHTRTLLSLQYYYKYKTNNSYNINILYKIISIVELTHFASLLHDDVIDNSKYRREEYSFNYLYGNKNSILIGDYLLINNFNKLLRILDKEQYSKYIINQFIKSSIDTVYGAYLENNLNNSIDSVLSNNSNIKSIIENYIRIAKLKTGSLFKFSCISGCILSNTDFNNVKQAASFGLVFGIIYQIQNDLNDYKYSNYKESEDYMQGNITFPIIILQSITDIRQIFYNKSNTNFNKIKELINTNQFKDTLNYIINKYINKILNIN